MPKDLVKRLPTVKRPYLRVIKELENKGVIFELGRYCPTKKDIKIDGQFIRIEDNYLQINLTGELKGFVLSLYFDNAQHAFIRLVEYFHDHKNTGVPAISPTTGNRCIIVQKDNKITYKKIA